MDGGKNAAACAGDLFIRGAGESELEFVRPIAPVNKVRVAIDQSGRNPAALAIDDAGVVAPYGRKLILRAREFDASFACCDRAGLNSPETWAPFDKCRKTGVQPNNVETVVVAYLNHSADRLRPYRPKGKRRLANRSR